MTEVLDEKILDFPVVAYEDLTGNPNTLKSVQTHLSSQNCSGKNPGSLAGE